MDRAQYLAAIVGAGPTILIAYFLEYRFYVPRFAKKKLPPGHTATLIGVFATFLATVLAVIELGTGKRLTIDFILIFFLVGLSLLLLNSLTLSDALRRKRENELDSQAENE